MWIFSPGSGYVFIHQYVDVSILMRVISFFCDFSLGPQRQHTFLDRDDARHGSDT